MLTDMALLPLASRAAAVVVAAVAGFASYRHIVDVADAAGERHLVALALPLAIDGLIVVATLAFVDDKRAGRKPRVSARFALGFGVAATLAANIASAEPTWIARAVAAVPAVSFLIAVEVLARRGRALTEHPLDTPPVQRVSSPKSLSAAERVKAASEANPGAPHARLAELAEVSVTTARRHRTDRINGSQIGV